MAEISKETIEQQKRLKQTYYRLFNTDDGRIVLEDLKSFCGLMRSSVCEQSPNELQTFFMEGKRRVILRVISQMERTENE